MTPYFIPLQRHRDGPKDRLGAMSACVLSAPSGIHPLTLRHRRLQCGHQWPIPAHSLLIDNFRNRPE